MYIKIVCHTDNGSLYPVGENLNTLTVANKINVTTGGITVSAGGVTVTGKSTFNNSITVKSTTLLQDSVIVSGQITLNGKVILNENTSYGPSTDTVPTLSVGQIYFVYE